MSESLRKINFSTWDFEVVNNEVKTVAINHHGYFHSWLIMDGSAMALVERSDGKVFKVDATDIQFIKWSELDNVEY